MKIKLLKDKSIRGNITIAGSTVDVSDLVAVDLIDNGDAEISEMEGRAEKTISKPKKTNKAVD
tara:strand:- start:3263 stop:3451 length:189 start_codon:yes stop_codon:yes gene_type:complete